MWILKLQAVHIIASKLYIEVIKKRNVFPKQGEMGPSKF